MKGPGPRASEANAKVEVDADGFEVELVAG
jgi:hypothetical protein